MTFDFSQKEFDLIIDGLNKRTVRDWHFIPWAYVFSFLLENGEWEAVVKQLSIMGIFDIAENIYKWNAHLVGEIKPINEEYKDFVKGIVICLESGMHIGEAYNRIEYFKRGQNDDGINMLKKMEADSE